MKPPPFAYADPSELEEALALLTEHGEDAKLLAGGQSLVPLLNFRLVRPGVLVDLNRVGGLGRLERRGGALRIGAMVREATLERSALVASGWPLLAEAARLIGHIAIRTRGTAGGSAAHADPAAELPTCFAALEARFHCRSLRSSRSLAAAEFFRGPLETALAADEMLVGLELRPLPPRTGTAFLELSRVHGDFALGGAAAVVTLDGDGRCERAALALLGAGPVPLRVPAAEELLRGEAVEVAAEEAAEQAAAVAEPPASDGDRAHRRALLRTLAERALRRAARRAEAQ